MMDEKKIEYLKKHLDQALSDNDYNEVNSCYQELLKFLDVTDIPDLAQKVNKYNNVNSKMHIYKKVDSLTEKNKKFKKLVGPILIAVGCLFALLRGGTPFEIITLAFLLFGSIYLSLNILQNNPILFAEQRRRIQCGVGVIILGGLFPIFRRISWMLQIWIPYYDYFIVPILVIIGGLLVYSGIKKNHTVSLNDLQRRLLITKIQHSTNVNIFVIGIAGGVGTMILGFILVMSGTGVFGSYNDHIMHAGLAVFIIGGALTLIGIIFTFVKNRSQIALDQCKSEIFKLIYDSQDKLKYLENVEIGNLYVGQIKNNQAHGFGVGYYSDNNLGCGFYVGDYKNGSKSGIGKLITDDMLMTLEGEFKEDQINGVVDIQWEDGGKWHGEYKNGFPWNGQGKTIIKNKIKQGIWKNGIMIS